MRRETSVDKVKKHEYSKSLNKGWTWTRWIIILIIVLVIIIFLVAVVYFFFGESIAVVSDDVASRSTDILDSFEHHELPAENVSGE